MAQNAVQTINQKLIQVLVEKSTQKVNQKLAQTITEKATQKIGQGITQAFVQKAAQKVALTITQKATQKISQGIAQATKKGTQGLMQNLTSILAQKNFKFMAFGGLAIVGVGAYAITNAINLIKNQSKHQIGSSDKILNLQKQRNEFIYPDFKQKDDDVLSLKSLSSILSERDYAENLQNYSCFLSLKKRIALQPVNLHCECVKIDKKHKIYQRIALEKWIGQKGKCPNCGLPTTKQNIIVSNKDQLAIKCFRKKLNKIVNEQNNNQMSQVHQRERSNNQNGNNASLNSSLAKTNNKNYVECQYESQSQKEQNKSVVSQKTTKSLNQKKQSQKQNDKQQKNNDKNTNKDQAQKWFQKGNGLF